MERSCIHGVVTGCSKGEPWCRSKTDCPRETWSPLDGVKESRLLQCGREMHKRTYWLGPPNSP